MGGGESRTQELERSVEALTAETETLRHEQSVRMAELQEERMAQEQAARRAVEAEKYAKQLEAQLDQTQRDAQLERYHAVAEETRKWEAREARLVRRVEELERAVSNGTAVPEDVAPGEHGGGVPMETASHIAGTALSGEEGGTTAGEVSTPFCAAGKSTLSLSAEAFTPSLTLQIASYPGSSHAGEGLVHTACACV